MQEDTPEASTVYPTNPTTAPSREELAQYAQTLFDFSMFNRQQSSEIRGRNTELEKTNNILRQKVENLSETNQRRAIQLVNQAFTMRKMKDDVQERDIQITGIKQERDRRIASLKELVKRLDLKIAKQQRQIYELKSEREETSQSNFRLCQFYRECKRKVDDYVEYSDACDKVIADTVEKRRKRAKEGLGVMWDDIKDIMDAESNTITTKPPSMETSHDKLPPLSEVSHIDLIINSASQEADDEGDVTDTDNETPTLLEEDGDKEEEEKGTDENVQTSSVHTHNMEDLMNQEEDRVIEQDRIQIPMERHGHTSSEKEGEIIIYSYSGMANRLWNKEKASQAIDEMGIRHEFRTDPVTFKAVDSCFHYIGYKGDDKTKAWNYFLRMCPPMTPEEEEEEGLIRVLG